MKNNSRNKKNIKIVYLSPFLLYILSVFTGCSKIQPEVSYTGELNPPKLNSQNLYKINSLIPISGTCDDKVSILQLSFDGGKTWFGLDSISSSLSTQCTTNGTFQAQIDINKININLTGGSANGLIKGTGDYGDTPSTKFNILIKTNQDILIGKSEDTRDKYKLKGKVKNNGEQKTTNSGNYKLIGKVKIQ